MSEPVRFETSVLSEIAVAAALAYPDEGCGALLGPRPGGGLQRVTLTLPIPNSESGRPRDRFEVAPRDYLAVEDEADRLGLALVGFWHSHPDWPAQASQTDRAYAWEGLLTVIVSVPAGSPREIAGWEITGPDEPFTPVPLEEGDDARPVTDLTGRVTEQGGS